MQRSVTRSDADGPCSPAGVAVIGMVSVQESNMAVFIIGAPSNEYVASTAGLAGQCTG